jgi:hypothetical protein
MSDIQRDQQAESEKKLFNKIYGRLTKVDVEEFNDFVTEGQLHSGLWEALKEISTYGRSVGEVTEGEKNEGAYEMLYKKTSKELFEWIDKAVKFENRMLTAEALLEDANKKLMAIWEKEDESSDNFYCAEPEGKRCDSPCTFCKSTPPQPTDDIVKALTGEPLVYSPSVTTGGDLPDEAQLQKWLATDEQINDLANLILKFFKQNWISTLDSLRDCLAFYFTTYAIAGRKHSSTQGEQGDGRKEGLVTWLGQTIDLAKLHEENMRLKSRIASLEGEQKWISVEEKEPDVEKTYLWCAVPVCEPPYVGSMSEDDFIDNYYTHYMELNNDFFPSPPISKDSKTDV